MERERERDGQVGDGSTTLHALHNHNVHKHDLFLCFRIYIHKHTYMHFTKICLEERRTGGRMWMSEKRWSQSAPRNGELNGWLEVSVAIIKFICLHRLFLYLLYNV